MDFDGFSLIYPNDETRKNHDSGLSRPDIDMYTLQELGLLETFNLKKRDLSDYLTTDVSVMQYRMDVFRDMMNCPELTDMLSHLVPVLNDILELRRLESNTVDTVDYLSSMTEIELYISSVNILQEGLSKVGAKIKSTAFLSLFQLINELSQSDYYRELNKKLQELTERVKEIKSVTIGVNLDTQLRPTSAGVLSVNPEQFHSGEVLDKILHLNFKNNQYTCIANLVPFGKKESENQKAALANAFNSAINDVYRHSLASWKKIVQMYVLEKTEFLLALMPEFEFLVKGTQMLNRLKDKGDVLCVPQIRPMEEKKASFIELYNPCVSLKINEKIVSNSIDFDEKATIYVLSGPNRGGKSVHTCALGLAQVMMQLGMFVPAESAILSPVDGIYTHFPSGADDTIDKGRLGEECARLSEIIDSVTPYSLVLLDESLSSTGSYEASYIAAEVLSGLSKIGCRCLFSTHLHELAAEIDSLNQKAKETGGAPIDTLVAGMEKEGKRSFKILRAKPDGKSYARDIAESYGLTYEKILNRIKK